MRQRRDGSGQLRRQLELRASVDELTGCLNRRAVLELLRTTSVDHAPGPTGIALVFADLDDFKAVSDRCGHTTGDRVFIEVGDRLRSAVRDVDEVGRLGGEQLLIVCPNIGGPGPALEIGDRIADSLQAQLRFGGNEVSLRASVGVAFTTDELDPERLTARADQAIYEAKRAGNGGQ